MALCIEEVFNILVRDAYIEDVEDILKLIQGEAELDGCLDALASKESDIIAAFFSTHPKASAILAVEGEKVIGIATFYNIYSTFIAKSGIWLDDLFIYPKYRKSGAGKALILRLCNIAKKNGCGRIDWIVARDNENGKGFYESLGAHIFEEVRHSRLDENAIDKLVSEFS